jgi:hypothetical protein
VVDAINTYDGYRQRSLELAVAAGRRAGLDVTDARVSRLRSTVQVELPCAKVVARVEPYNRVAMAYKQVQVVRFWSSQAAPIAPLVRPELQPFVFTDGAVTLWVQLQSKGSVDLHELGQTVRALHEAFRRAPDTALPRLDPFADILARIEWPTDWLADADRAELRRRAETLGHWWQERSADDPLGTLLVHGDLSVTNSVKTDQGALLVDLEDAGIGPASWDLAPATVGVRRFGESQAELERFFYGYGADPRGWTGYETICQIYELSVALWALRCSEMSPALAEEAMVRVAGSLGRSQRQWRSL